MQRCSTARSRLKTALALSLFAATTLVEGCALPDRYPDVLDEARPSRPHPSEIEHRLILIGDAGYAEPADPVMAALQLVASDLGDSRTTIVFLGDNVYPEGLPLQDALGYEQARKRLETQLDVVLASGASAIFIPGNHDHRESDEAGIRRQAEHIAAYSGNRAKMWPPGTCPGPIVADLGQHIRLVVIDTVLLREEPEPAPCRGFENGGSDEVANTGFYKALSNSLASAANRLVVVAGHNPLESVGPHGGFFSWQEHVLPVPVLTTLFYVALRTAGLHSTTDLESPRYRKMRRRITEVLAANPSTTVLFASGHEHSIQILELEMPEAEPVLQVVSGAGTTDELSPVGRRANTIMATPYPGFVVIDVLRRYRSDSRSLALLEVVEITSTEKLVTVDGQSVEFRREFRMWILKR